MRIGLSIGIFILAFALFAANVIGLLVEPERHALALERVGHKQGLRLLPAAEVIAKLDRLRPDDPEHHLLRATELIAGGIYHYWPDEDAYDADVTLQIYENWAVALLGWAERVLVAGGVLNQYRFARLERLDHADILHKGIGRCSQASLALSSYLVRAGVDARLVGLDGHVVVAARAGGQDYLLDPDYNVVIQAPLQAVQNSPRLAASAYLGAGYSAEVAEELALIFGPEGNFVGGAHSYHPRHALINVLVALLKWGVPLVAMLLVLFAWRHRHRGSV